MKAEIIRIGKKLYDFRLVAARGGNLSARIERELILITSSGACLGELKQENIIEVSLSSVEQTKGLTTEFPLHSLIYTILPAQRIIHCHPPLINAYYSLYDKLESLTFENKLFLGRVPLVIQNSPSITQPEKVIEALKSNNIVVIRNHGVVCIADKFDDAFYLIEELEEAVKMAALARLFEKERPHRFEEALKETLKSSGKTYAMFSQEHILAIADLINQDKEFLEQAKELNLTTELAIKSNEVKGSVYKFNFRQGKISAVEYTEDAPFVISGPQEAWRLVFAGRLEPFVAITQGKFKLKGELGKLSRWYVPLARMFFLFQFLRISKD